MKFNPVSYVYANVIIQGLRTFSSIPEANIKEEVRQILIERGHPELATEEE